VIEEDLGDNHLVINASHVIRVGIGRRIVQKEGVKEEEEVDHLREEMMIEEKVGALFVKRKDI